MAGSHESLSLMRADSRDGNLFVSECLKELIPRSRQRHGAFLYTAAIEMELVLNLISELLKC
jgi:hypothetical protein